MDYTRLSDTELVNFARNVETQLAEHRVECLDAELSDELAGEIGPENTAFEDDIDESVQLTALLRSVNERRAERRKKILKYLSKVKTNLQAARGARPDYELCGITYRKKWTAFSADDPTELTVAGLATGVNVLKFEGNNPPSRVRFEIWRREGKKHKWECIGSTTKQTYHDEPVLPGKYYQYKVRAASARNLSNWTDVAVVYPSP